VANRWRALLRWPAAAAELTLSVMGVAYLIFGLSLVLQRHRWQSTPAYHVLLQVFTAPEWGALFLVSGLSMAVAVRFYTRRPLVVASLTLAFMLTTGWMLAFVVRYLTSPNTTPETWVSWAVFDYLLLRVALAQPSSQPASAETAAEAITYAMTVSAQEQRVAVLAALQKSQEAAQAAVTDAARLFSHTEEQERLSGPALEALTAARIAMQQAEAAYARSQSPK